MGSASSSQIPAAVAQLDRLSCGCERGEHDHTGERAAPQDAFRAAPRHRDIAGEPIGRGHAYSPRRGSRRRHRGLGERSSRFGVPLVSGAAASGALTGPVAGSVVMSTTGAGVGTLGPRRWSRARRVLARHPHGRGLHLRLRRRVLGLELRACAGACSALAPTSGGAAVSRVLAVTLGICGPTRTTPSTGAPRNCSRSLTRSAASHRRGGAARPGVLRARRRRGGRAGHARGAARSRRRAGPAACRCPIAAPVGDRYGPRGDGFHPGIDFPAPTGTPVRAAASGRVAFAGYDDGFGLTVVLDHGNGVHTRYAHLSTAAVSLGRLRHRRRPRRPRGRDRLRHRPAPALRGHASRRERRPRARPRNLKGSGTFNRAEVKGSDPFRNRRGCGGGRGGRR